MQQYIGIPTDQLAGVSPYINTQSASIVPQAIKEAVIDAGGVPLILPFPARGTRSMRWSKPTWPQSRGYFYLAGPILIPRCTARNRS